METPICRGVEDVPMALQKFTSRTLKLTLAGERYLFENYKQPLH